MLTDTIIKQAVFDQLNGIELRECTWSRRDLRVAAENDLGVSLAHKTMVVRSAVNEFCDAYNAANDHTTNEVVLSVLEEPEETTRVFKALNKLVQTFGEAEPTHASNVFEEQICNATESRDVLKERIKFTREATRANTMAQEELRTRMQKDYEQHQLDMRQWQQKEENTAYAHNEQVRALEEKLEYASKEAALNREQAALMKIKAESITQHLHEATIAQYRVPSPPPRCLIDMRTVNAQIVNLSRDPRKHPKAKERDVVAADFFGEAAFRCATNFVDRGWVPRQLRLTGRGAGMSQDKKRKTGMAAAGRNAVQDSAEVQGNNGANHRGDHPSVKWLGYVAGAAERPKTIAVGLPLFTRGNYHLPRILRRVG